MAKGKSGRIVLEIDPALKRSLYLELEKRQKTLKEWFVSEAQGLLYGEQENLFESKLLSKEKHREESK